MTEHTKDRILEIIPGFLVWATLLGIIIFSFVNPLWTIYFIIAFDIYWCLRIFYMLVHLLVSWRHYQTALSTDWQEKLKTVSNYQDYWHLIFLPTYKEPYQVVEAPFIALAASKYDLKKMIVVLAGEARDQENFAAIAEKIKQKFGNTFYQLLITIHPDGLPDEIPGKGSNTYYAAQQAKTYIDQLGLDYSKVIVSNFDIDTNVHDQYFACLTYNYSTHPNPTHASYQPVAVYTNNVWQSNPIIRVVASSTTFWLFTDLARSERLFTFSSHSMSFKALVDVGFWDRTIVTEDSRIFLQCLVQYHGDYETVPLYLPVYMNTVDIGKFWKSLGNQYKQMRRWAWGVEHFPWMVRQFWFKNGQGRKIPLNKKIYYLWNQTEGVYSWATAPLVIFIAGYLPLLVGGDIDRQTTLFQNAPLFLSYLMRASMISMFVIAILYTIMLPKKPDDLHRGHYLLMLLQWAVVPITLILFGSIPATDAQTRLMLGGRFRLGFWVTEKR